MSDEHWEYQIRINLSAEFAQVARRDINHPSLKPLADVLAKYNAVIKNQFDAFADYCRDAEQRNDTDSTLYRWTKDLVSKPEKEAQYATRFSVYADGGKEVYAREIADGLEADLKALLDSGMVTKVNKFSTDPAKNPQAGPQFR